MINFTLKQRALGAILIFLMAFYILYTRPVDMETFWQGEQPTSIAVAYEEWGTGKSEAGTTSRREEILTEDPDEIQRFCAVLNARKLRREIPWAALTGGESFSYEETGLVRIWISVNYAKRDGVPETVSIVLTLPEHICVFSGGRRRTLRAGFLGRAKTRAYLQTVAQFYSEAKDSPKWKYEEL